MFSIIKQFNNAITSQPLQQELQDFASKWETLSLSSTEEYYTLNQILAAILEMTLIKMIIKIWFDRQNNFR